ncbi:MAG: AraC family transcriptional regulator [Cytophagales bacterium]|nr:AraC family transcriptional regulator [Armatimonadota bacterium]
MFSDSSETVVRAPSDPLSEVLRDLRIAGVSYGRCELTHPWGIDFPPQGPARFHFVASGGCWLHGADAGWTRLEAGDVALLPHGSGHTLADAIRGPARPLGEIPLKEIGDRTYRMSAGGGGRLSLLFCCSVKFEEPAIDPLLELMPTTLLVRSAARGDTALPLLLETMAEEVVSERVGSATVLTRLADVVIARILRAWVEAPRTETTGWLAAIRDPKIGRALAAIHRHPGAPWSVRSLADVAQLSRSIFSERFASVVGVSPARYLARWRMHVASVWLRRERLTVAEVSLRLGYESEASFSRAFKRLVGVPPSALRRSDL